MNLIIIIFQTEKQPFVVGENTNNGEKRPREDTIYLSKDSLLHTKFKTLFDNDGISLIEKNDYKFDGYFVLKVKAMALILPKILIVPYSFRLIH